MNIVKILIVVTIGVVLLVGIIMYITNLPGEKFELDTQLPLTPSLTVESNEEVAPSEATYKGSYLVHERYNFSLRVPENMTAVERKLGTASAVILFSTNDEKKYFQLFITPYGKNEITQERLASDLNGGTVSEMEEVLVGTEQLPAVMFTHTDVNQNESREIWLIHNDFLFEFSAAEESHKMLLEVLTTFLHNK